MIKYPLKHHPKFVTTLSFYPVISCSYTIACTFLSSSFTRDIFFLLFLSWSFQFSFIFTLFPCFRRLFNIFSFSSSNITTTIITVLFSLSISFFKIILLRRRLLYILCFLMHFCHSLLRPIISFFLFLFILFLHLLCMVILIIFLQTFNVQFILLCIHFAFSFLTCFLLPVCSFFFVSICFLTNLCFIPVFTYCFLFGVLNHFVNCTVLEPVHFFLYHTTINHLFNPITFSLSNLLNIPEDNGLCPYLAFLSFHLALPCLIHFL
ncbi:unnamed protein product [Acanthosepion pharaonis]|uniref:Uncharacterized protein n=1 Tax=Acanthosepion pharaonis TaxID=158019 RepID=A0A812BDS0_ACAPH|nr:unnamed protein product [Sepia pharaonis]